MKYDVTYNDRKSVVYGYDQDEYISSYLAKGIFYEKPLLEHILKMYEKYEVECVVDVGANVGNHAVFFHDVMGVKDIICFEPNPNNYNRLKLSAPFATNHQVALSDREGGVSTVPNPNNMGATYCTDGGYIDAKTLDSYKLSPDLIKIDAENMECQVLHGALETVFRSKPIMFVEHNDTQHLYEFNRILQSAGLKYFIKPFVERQWEMFEYIPWGRI